MPSFMASLTVVACVVFAVFFPTSSAGELPDVTWIVMMWLVVLAILAMTVAVNRLDITAVVVSVWTLLYLVIVTAAFLGRVRGAELSVARIGPIVALLVLTCVRFRPVRIQRWPRLVFDAMCGVLLAWNFAIIAGNQVVKDFTADWFNQYQETALYYSMLAQKPVSAFGVHTYASYFYFLFFTVCLHGFRLSGRARYLVFSLGFLVSTVFLTSQSSFVMLVLMVGMLVLYSLREPGSTGHRVPGAIPLLGAFATAVLLLVSSSLYSSLSSRYDEAFGSEINGVFARYSAGNFEANFLAMGSSLGIGFTTPEGVRFADSAYLVYFTMGHVLLIACVYLNLVRFYWSNLPHSVALPLIIATLAFEAAAVATFSHRFTLLHVLVCYLVISFSQSAAQEKEAV